MSSYSLAKPLTGLSNQPTEAFMPDETEPDNKKIEHQSSAEIRQLKRAQRCTLSASVQWQHSKSLCQNASKEKIYRSSKNIAFYLANDGEIDPSQLLEHARFLGKNIYLPILSPVKNSLYFAPYQADGQLKLNRFDIPEPVCHPSEWKTARQLDLLFLPLVAFDLSGNRMGMGGGFYDRTLAYLQHRHYWRKPVLIGLAHEIQKIGQLDSQRWDIPLDFIITEELIYKG